MMYQKTEDQALATALASYVAFDRRGAGGGTAGVPARSSGTVLFADISGSTALAEALVEELGRRRGAEEVTRQLNLVYEELIQTLHRYGGSVIGFSGDAITCWLPDDDGRRGIACAQEMQESMVAFREVETPAGSIVELAIKVAITAGNARRFVVGHPDIQLFDVLAGSLLDELAVAEHLADRGEIIVPHPLAMQFSGQVEILAQREEARSHARFAVIRAFGIDLPEPAIKMHAPQLPPDHELTPWIQRDVYVRLKNGQGEFLAELRPAVALFFRFGGFQFDTQENAPERLDHYIQAVQQIVQSYGGNLIQLTMGDKGSYAYAAFGAPRAHEDDVDRAIAAALDIQEISSKFVGPVQIGVSHGLMRTGAYGSSVRRTYGVLGDEVNVAARLMQNAEPGQVLVSESAVKLAHDHLDWQAMPDVKAKGKQGLIRVFQPVRTQAPALDQSGPRYALPMVGRHDELERLREQLDLVADGAGRVLGITAGAGMGKTRLAFELIEKAANRSYEVFTGECPSYGTHSSYLVWRNIWKAILGVNEVHETDEMIAAVRSAVEGIDADLEPRVPLLGSVLNLPIEDNELTANFDAKLRKASLESLLISILRSKAQDQALLIFLDDVQWIDALSLDLLKATARAIGHLPVLVLLTYRDEEPGIGKKLGLVGLSHFSEIKLNEFTEAETRALLELKVNQLYGSRGEMSSQVVKQISERAQGNPFYIEELLNLLKDRQLDLRDVGALEQVALPSSLASLILSRIDQLEENQKVTLRLASVIGRIFREGWLTEAFHDALPSDQIQRDLEQLRKLELIQFDTPEPELTYLFKHIVTHEVAYDSLPFSTRSALHEKLGIFIETAYRDTIDQYLDFLAHHYSLSGNDEKKRIYLLLAGKAAQTRYANQTAIDYYQEVLDLLDEKEQIEVLADLASTKVVVGDWDEAREYYTKVIEKAGAIGEEQAQARFQAELGEFCRRQGLYDEAHLWLDLAARTFSQIDDSAGIGQVLHYQGTLAATHGDFESARRHYGLSLDVRVELDDAENIANIYNNLGVVARLEGNYEDSRTFQERALSIRREVGDKRQIAISLNNLGFLFTDLDELSQAQTYLEESLVIQREVGDRWAIANVLNNLANVARGKGNFMDAARMYHESLQTNQELGDLYGLAFLLEDVSVWVLMQDKYSLAVRLSAAAEALRKQIGAPRSATDQEKLETSFSKVYKNLTEGEISRQTKIGRELSLEAALQAALEELDAYVPSESSLRVSERESQAI